MKLLVKIIILTYVCAVAISGQEQEAAPLYLEDYHPIPMLKVDETEIRGSKFPSVDVHTHFPMSEWANADEMIRAMDIRNVYAVVNLSGGSGARLEEYMRNFTDVYPERLITFYTLPFDGIDDPGYGHRLAEEIRKAVDRGVRGIKVHKWLGLRVRFEDGTLVPIDHERLDPIWEVCAELGIPVLIHSADPVAWFDPVDQYNERAEQLRRWGIPGYSGPEFPDHRELVEQRNNIIERHSETIFIGAHMGDNPEDLAYVASLLDRYPNYYVEISARIAELGRQPYTARRFFIGYQDRILFGTDRTPAVGEMPNFTEREIQPRHRVYCRFLETRDEYFDYYYGALPPFHRLDIDGKYLSIDRNPNLPPPIVPTGRWKIYGIYLPDEVLEKVYYRNAEKIIPGLRIPDDWLE